MALEKRREGGEINMNTQELMLVLIGVTSGLVQVLKMADKDEVLSRFYPILALIVGFSLSFWGMGLDLLSSLIVPLSSMGLYSGIKKTIE